MIFAPSWIWRALVVPSGRTSRADGFSKGAGVGELVVGCAEFRAVEEIVELEAQFKFGSFGERGVFHQDHVPIVDPRAVEAVAR